MLCDVAVIGGGAAGFFSALEAKERCPRAQVLLLEKTRTVLSKVRISGGGRCNVTHACFDPRELVLSYPRGYKELVGPFCRFQPRDTIDWFSGHGVSLKQENDGRIFPTTDSSSTIIDCLLQQIKKYDIPVLLRQNISAIEKNGDIFVIKRVNDSSVRAKSLILATGSNKEGFAWAEQFSHKIVPPVPSLFTFNVPCSPLAPLSGVSVETVCVGIRGTPFSQIGPLLITHFGFSGPSILKLSAWAARTLFEKNYLFSIWIDWVPKYSLEDKKKRLIALKQHSPEKTLRSENLFSLPKQVWRMLIGTDTKLNDFSLRALDTLAEKLHKDVYHVKGKTTHKEEFVTCGGIALEEVDFRTMESKKYKGLFFCGEILNIDGITGGFNFQNAWTTGYIAGRSSVNEMD